MQLTKPDPSSNPFQCGLRFVLARIALSVALFIVATFAFAGDKNLVVRLTVVAHAVTGPNYQISVFEDGKIQYNGEVGTKIVGKAYSKMSRSEVQQISRQLEAIGFMEMQDKYYGPTKTEIEQLKSERPKERKVTTLGLRHDVYRAIEARLLGKRKKVEFSGMAPQSLLDVARDIEHITQAYKWTGFEGN